MDIISMKIKKKKERKPNIVFNYTALSKVFLKLCVSHIAFALARITILCSPCCRNIPHQCHSLLASMKNVYRSKEIEMLKCKKRWFL